MNKRIILLYSFMLCFIYVPEKVCASVYLQDRSEAAWVFFTDKKGVDFDPYSFFDQKAIERRLRHGICLYDTLDVPVRDEYVQELSRFVDSVGVVSRWFNAAFVHVPSQNLSQIKELGFVRDVRPAALRKTPVLADAETDAGSLLADADTSLLHAQVSHMNGHYFHKNNINGKGIRIAVFDAGFRGVNTHPAFRHLTRDGRIIATYDFHRNREHVFTASVHGTMVLSSLAGVIDGVPLGLATGAEFLLARTEIRREPLAEEQYWLAAVEWADQLGADIINSSLGYVYHRYFPEEMDGQTSLVAQAARIATRKGILIVNAAGNQGNNNQWRIVVTPADVDSVLTVGALDFNSMLRASYSSVGPAADGTMKPNVSALGQVVAANRRSLGKPQGTSFASPLVAGFAACLWQMNPSWSNMQVFQAIERSASLYPYYDYAHGYGIPQACYFFDDYPGIQMPTFDIVRENKHISINMRIRVRQEANDETAALKEKQYLYYQIRNEDGSIARYFVIDLEGITTMKLPKDDFQPGQYLWVHYNGFTSSMKITDP
ncbi:MAG: S8 family serine peptidase [Bacteroidales bacterium]|nr:S8 family serine peptidase [Bacteroidales bacterium]